LNKLEPDYKKTLTLSPTNHNLKTIGSLSYNLKDLLHMINTEEKIAGK